MIWRPPRSKQTDTLFPDATLCRSEVTLEEVDYDAAAVGVATEQFLGGELHVVRRFFAGVVAPVANCVGKRPLLASPMRDCSHSSAAVRRHRSEEHTSELKSLMRYSHAVFCLKKTITNTNKHT